MKKALILSATIALMSTSALANDWYPGRGQRGFIDNGSARAPQVQSTRAGNPHGDDGQGFRSTIESRSQMNNHYPSAPYSYNAHEISPDTTRADFPHRDPANANSAYFNANANRNFDDGNTRASQKMGLSHSQIREVQHGLNDNGYRVAVDGMWGPQTSNAVRRFQARNDLNATGKLNNETLRALDVSYAPMNDDMATTRSGDERRWNKNSMRNDATTTDQRNPSQMDRTRGSSYNDKNWENTQR